MIDTGNGVFPVFRVPSTNPLNPQFSFLADEQNNFAWAGFANLSYDFSDEFTIDASLRYDHDKRENTTLTPTAFLPNVPGFPQGATGDVRTVSFDDWQPKVTLTWEPNPDLTLYGGYSRGFRSGGFNQTGVGAVAFANGIVGVERHLPGRDRRHVRDRRPRPALRRPRHGQRRPSSPPIPRTAISSSSSPPTRPRISATCPRSGSTASSSRRRRVRRPASSINVGIGYTWSEIKDFPDPAVIGNEAPLISRYTWNLGAQYRGDISTGLGLLARIDYRRTGRTWWDVPNSTSRDPIDLVNARLGLEGEQWSFTLFAENLFDEEYNAEFSPGGFVFKARPLRYGAEATFRF